MTADEQHWQRLIQGLRTGDAAVVHDFCTEYGDALHDLAEKHLPRMLRRRVGADDVVQSACRTFLRRAKAGEFELADSGGLWGLLCAITLTKVREQARYHMRQKRGLAAELETPVGSDESGAGFQPRAPGPTPAEAAEFADQFQQLLAAMDDEERAVVDLKLQDYTQEEIAERLQCSERTVRRILKRIQSRLSRAFETE